MFAKVVKNSVFIAAFMTCSYAVAFDVPFECTIEGNNAGCVRNIYCPSGLVHGIIAACNLEWGTVSDEELSSVPLNYLWVVRASDNVDSGYCGVNSTWIRSDATEITLPVGSNRVTVYCREHDRNGGDCQIRGIRYCE